MIKARVGVPTRKEHGDGFQVTVIFVKDDDQRFAAKTYDLKPNFTKQEFIDKVKKDLAAARETEKAIPAVMEIEDMEIT